ncbi:MAG: Exodeoxyribonuclease VII small subunit [Candidatus Carbobacillus altaicus]|uniref:Exodeoxyribonuclease 7 small subunit n=1 Tax=Candidatus Carbonibacillus altaicus TaxID=2163959 RepID=A0A2R6Y3D5_9BACL|nr:MAG: Exodeoxyribonuclease VII small subunit [Candidatus Carbobacillus altaicus]
MRDLKTLKEQVKELSFERAMERLEAVVEQLEKGSVPLEEAIDLYQEGMLLAKHCETKLSQVEQKVRLLDEETLGAFTHGGHEETVDVDPFDIADEDLPF